MKPPRDEHAEARRQIRRRASLYTAAFVTAAVAVAVLGAALVAWALTGVGQPFRRTWLIVSVVVILPGLLAAIWKVIRAR